MGEKAKTRLANIVTGIPRPDDGELLFKQGPIEVRETPEFRWLHDDGAIQSIMDRAQPGRLVLTTHRAMLAAWLIPPQVTRVLNVGSGVGSFERFASVHSRSLDWSAVEHSGLMQRLAREFFEWPSAYQVSHTSAEAWVQRGAQPYDVVLIDLFERRKNAACLYDKNFHAGLRARLSAQGAIAINAIPDDQSDMLRLLLAVRDQFLRVWVSEIENHSNVIILASKDENSKLNTARVAAGTAWADVPMDEIAARYILLPDPR